MLHKALKLIRKYHAISQSELCTGIGISNSYLSEIESGKKQPSIEVLSRYSEFFKIPLSSIIFFSEHVDDMTRTEKLRKGIASSVICILEWNLSRNEEKNKKEDKLKA